MVALGPLGGADAGLVHAADHLGIDAEQLGDHCESEERFVRVVETDLPVEGFGVGHDATLADRNTSCRKNER